MPTINSTRVTNDADGERKSRKVLFTDEKSFYLVAMPNRKNHVIRCQGVEERRIDSHKFEFEKVVKVAGGICYDGKTSLIETQGKLSTEKYEPILKHSYSHLRMCFLNQLKKKHK